MRGRLRSYPDAHGKTGEPDLSCCGGISGKRQTPSVRRRLQKIGQRENRWMQDDNQCLAKILANSHPSGILFVLEDLTGFQGATGKVCRKDRDAMVFWSFYDLQRKIEDKAGDEGPAFLLVDPAPMSQRRPQCGRSGRANGDKKNHAFCCRECGHRPNDDRAGAMNIRSLGVPHGTDPAVADGEILSAGAHAIPRYGATLQSAGEKTQEAAVLCRAVARSYFGARTHSGGEA